MNSQRSRHVVRYAARFAVAAAAAVLALLGGELVAWGLGLAPAFKPIVITRDDTVYKRSSNPILGFELRANYRNDHADLATSYPRTSGHGQRDIERTVEKPPGTQRILILGDSVVEGEGIPTIDQTMSRQLEKLYPAGTTQVLNFGVSGYCTRAEIELLRVKGLKFQPDVVLVVFVENDFDNFNTQVTDLASSVERPEIVKFLFRRSHLVRALCVRFNLYQFGDAVDPMARTRRSIGDNNVVDGLRTLRQLADLHGFEPVIAIWPRFERNRIINLHVMPDGSDDLVIERNAEMCAIPTARMSHYFVEHASSAGKPVNLRRFYTLNDGMHPSPEGCRVAAQALKSIVDRLQHQQQSGFARSVSKDPATVDATVRAAAALGKRTLDYSRILNNRGVSLQKAGKLAEAVEHYRLAFEAKPEFAVALKNLGNALESLGRFDEAVTLWRRAVKRDPNNATLYRKLGKVLSKLGQVDQAIDQYRVALRISPGFALARYDLARALRRSGKVDQAVNHMRRVLEVAADNADVHHELGLALQSSGRAQEALKSFRLAVRLRPRSPQSLARTAWILATHEDDAIRDANEALQLAERAAQMTDHRDPVVLDVLAAACAAAGRFDNAAKHATSAEWLAREIGADDLAREIHKRLEQYKHGQPYRDRAAPATSRQ